MELTRVIIGSIVTEKAERQKTANARHVFTLRVAPTATKIEIARALESYFGVDVESVRVMRVQPKTRLLGTGTMEKRHSYRKALVTLTKNSKTLDLSSFQAQA